MSGDLTSIPESGVKQSCEKTRHRFLISTSVIVPIALPVICAVSVCIVSFLLAVVMLSANSLAWTDSKCNWKVRRDT